MILGFWILSKALSSPEIWGFKVSPKIWHFCPRFCPYLWPSREITAMTKNLPIPYYNNNSQFVPRWTRARWGGRSVLPVPEDSKDREHHPDSILHDGGVCICQPSLSGHLPSQSWRWSGGEHQPHAKVEECSDCLQCLQWMCANTSGLQVAGKIIVQI